MALKRGIEKGAEAVVEALKKNAIPVTEREQMAQVAAISANNDRAIGELIARGDGEGRQGRRHHRRGVEGHPTETEYVEGMHFDRGYISPYFVTNPERMEA